MAFRQPPLYVKLYLWFLGILLVLGGVSALLVMAIGRDRLRPPRGDYGARMINHLSRAMSGLSDESLRDAVDSVHDDLGYDIVVLDARLEKRAASGQPIAALPPEALLERARRGVTWMPPPTGIVAGPLDGGVLLLRFPGVLAQRNRLRRLALTVIGLLVGAALLYPLSRSITRPLERLTKAAEAFGKGDLNVRSGIDRRDEVGRLARTFDEMAGRIQAARRAERELLANVSHEFRTPLARLQVALELLDAKDESAVKRVDSIREEVEELDRLIGDVLTTTRLELASVPLNKEPLSLRELAEKARDRALALDPSRTIEVDVPADLRVEADEALLSRVLDNLIDNARKYDGSGGPIRVEARREDGAATLAVQDRGQGIPPAELEKVFEPFFRGDDARLSGTGGFGLGLALARRVAEAHGGSIRASNGPGGGARIELRLPASA
jgi:signal transduction histidine kinase